MKPEIIPPFSQIRDEPLANALSKRYLEYALSSIVSRSLPDVRDGLKPVHRRLLFAMRQLKLNPQSGFKKCARVVGDVIGKYHPHGDVSVYDAMVRLAQSFSVRYPLVDGQGNFGNIDGDSHAAMRYTEARLTMAGDALMDGLDENTVDFEPTYDGTEQEPVLMPASFPNLLANGTSGIAVGMATNIPPHNLDEIAQALIYLLDHPETKTADLIQFIPAPDFPTGGVLLLDKPSILNAYETGRGAFSLRAKWNQEDLSYGNYQIIITEIPFGIQKSRLIEKIASLLEDKKLPLINDIRDESAEDIRIVIEPKNRTIDPNLLMGYLFKLSDLEVQFHLNMNVLDATRTPREMSLVEVLQAYLDHRQVVLQKKSRFRLGNIDHRLEILGGLLKAYLNLDRVISIIRENDEAKPLLMKEFDLTELQADSILNMRLRSLRKLEEFEMQKEAQHLSTEKENLEVLLTSSTAQKTALKTELKTLLKLFGKQTTLGARRTALVDSFNSVNLSVEDLIEKEPLTILLSTRGWIRALKGHQDLNQDFSFKDGDSRHFALHAQTTDKLILVTSSGKFFTIEANKLSSGLGFGEPLQMILDLNGDDNFKNLFVYRDTETFLCASSFGYGFRLKATDIIAQTRNGKTVMNLDDGSSCFGVISLDEKHDYVASLGTNRKLLIFKTEEIPFLGRGKGVILQKFREKDTQLADLLGFNGATGFYWETGRGQTTLSDFRLWVSKRATVGRTPPTGFPRKNLFHTEK